MSAAKPDHRPLVGITIGDPAGVGPEIVVKALAESTIYETVRPLVVGDAQVLQRARELCHIALDLHSVKAPSSGWYEPGAMDLIDLHNVYMEALEYGQVQYQAGRAAAEYVVRAVKLALAGEIDAIATAPLNKEALKAGGVPYLDHTQMLSALTNSSAVMTMFTVGELKIFFATRHISLRQACEEIKKEVVLKALRNTAVALVAFGLSRPRIAVAALNPHAGEQGLFGREEIEEIAPAVAQAKAEGLDVVGPVAADSVFHLALQGRYAAVLSLFHDQGHIAAKTLDFERTVAVTTGLPFVRSSVDHGTAFDIAGKGIASAVSMVEAIRVAAEYAKRFAEHRTKR